VVVAGTTDELVDAETDDDDFATDLDGLRC